MAGKIFISYRRDDDPGFAGRLCDTLAQRFRRKNLFVDVDDLPPGTDFVNMIEAEIAQCDVLLAIVGKRWIDARDNSGQRRLEDENDFVRIEIASALEGDKRVIPVLVEQAPVLSAERLPDDLKPLARRQAIRLSHERFKADVGELITKIESALDEAATKRRDSAKEAARETRTRKEPDRDEAKWGDQDGPHQKVDSARDMDAADRRWSTRLMWVGLTFVVVIFGVISFANRDPSTDFRAVRDADWKLELAPPDEVDPPVTFSLLPVFDDDGMPLEGQAIQVVSRDYVKSVAGKKYVEIPDARNLVCAAQIKIDCSRTPLSRISAKFVSRGKEITIWFEPDGT